ncbi:Carboxylate-amine ligase [Herminiimonas arsenicoxydans]|uniref:Putative glutamate--cysteine ligase 2 n=1 Tax=Herminiimonas arsenicoxydans TaxID=204773 RepID=GCS2_HERAR|nr:RecName: Full=Putative glutamate--cysteine ligase 2; AltName: Full=Gamma-glutamylcysteine synthetase 2; Short=GCS 2; Short=Gamma-GCS 2 [Herminiimonas arsenicoxydans]CAL62644.1 Carboxylate-amine ligase [Herminiimonas arsenicoxydans]
MLEFNNSTPLTMGVELELQIVNRRDYNLTRGSDDLLQIINKTEHGYDIKPEITESMIEIATAVHTDHVEMLAELTAMRTLLVTAANKLNLGLAGGGAHPFQHWEDQRIYPTDRYRLVSELYGYLAKQFTVYGQHIHIGCASGDDAIRLTHLLARQIPHFIALSASSPFYQGVDTSFQSSRLTSINAFPLSGTMPFVSDWEAFNTYFIKMSHLGIVASMKDFYWDIRPKPEYGTVEIRVCDTPLAIETAVALGAYAQTLSKYYFAHTELEPTQDTYLTYSYNRFQACRFGLNGALINPITGTQSSIKDDILQTFELLKDVAEELGTTDAIELLRQRVLSGQSDADWLRASYEKSGSLSDAVRQQSAVWMAT